MEIDYEGLRKDLLDYFGTALQSEPFALVDLFRVEFAENDELLAIARNNNFNINNYTVVKTYVKKK